MTITVNDIPFEPQVGSVEVEVKYPVSPDEDSAVWRYGFEPIVVKLYHEVDFDHPPTLDEREYALACVGVFSRTFVKNHMYPPIVRFACDDLHLTVIVRSLTQVPGQYLKEVEPGHLVPVWQSRVVIEMFEVKTVKTRSTS